MDKFLNLLPLLVIWLGVLVFFRINKIWVFYFMWGAVGLTIFMVFSLSNTIVEQTLSRTAISIITAVNRYFNIPVMSFADAGTMLMTGTLISGYTSLEVGTECSGLLECSVFWGLTLFFPVFSFRKKLLVLAVGSFFIYLINLVRVQLIITAIFIGGRDTIFIAHTVIGRGVFFLLMIALYWVFFTRSTLFFLNKQNAA